ncbi:MAG TPA: hypothetical protein VKU91_04240 [Acidimicrobiales bacterium]|nr:hypothetical protein [Acidimicrobiales bacterium]
MVSAVVIGLLVMAMVWERRAGYYPRSARAIAPVQAIPINNVNDTGDVRRAA